MTLTSPKLKIAFFLGRHQTAASGLWVYGSALFSEVAALLLKEESLKEQAVDKLSAYYSGAFLADNELYGPFADLCGSLKEESEKLVFKDLRGGFFSRRLALVSDLFFPLDGYDIVHGTANILPLRGGRFRVLTLHDLLQAYPVKKAETLYQKLKVRLYRVLLNYLCHNVNLIITDLEKTAEEIKERFNVSAPIEVIYPGLNNAYEEAELNNTNRKTGHFLAFASHDPRKNIERVLGAFKSCVNQELKLTVLASCPEIAAKLSANSHAVALGDRLKVTHSILAKDMPGFYASFQGLIFPSLAEGFGYPIYEALSQGTPVLCNSEHLVASINAHASSMIVKCDPESTGELVAGIEKLSALNITDIERQQISELVKKEFSFRSHAKKLLKLYHQMMEAKTDG